MFCCGSSRLISSVGLKIGGSMSSKIGGFKRGLAVVLSVFLIAALVACNGTRVKSREKGVLAGGALGAGLGAIVGNQVGNSGAGIAIGSGLGAIAGGLVGNAMDAQEARREDQSKRLDYQSRQLEENRRLIDDLRRAGADVRETSRGVVVNVPDVLFEFGRADLTRGAEGTVGEIARAVRDFPQRRIFVEGHTDSVGSASFNDRLSRDRARSVADSLVERGVAPRRISTRGFGETQPIASNSSSNGRAKNRRVEVIIEN